MINIKDSTIVCLLALTATGCAPKLWFKQSALQGDFERDKFTCMQGSQQNYGSAVINANGGSAVNTVITNQPLFASCMNAKGWSLQSKDEAQANAYAAREQANANNEKIKARIDALKVRIKENCDKPELSEYYAKTACLGNEITFDQIADASKITDSQKKTLLKQRREISSIESESDEIQRLRGAAGERAIDILNKTSRPTNDKNNLDLYNGIISWGEYSQKRKDIALKIKDDLK